MTHQDFMDSLPAKRRKKIEARAAEILAEEMTLQELRRIFPHMISSKSLESLRKWLVLPG